MPKNQIVLDDKLHWYKDAIIYELHIKAFRDGNGDGIGDFEGLMQKLDYLEDLGATAIWLLPFYPSPLKDDGYDIADYYSINTSYGNIREFKVLLKEAHKRNLKVITELVINHTSDQHPWFQRARKAPKGSPERDFYVWTDNPDQYKDVRIIFQDFETSNWTWDSVAQQYYWHRFFNHQPDLNYDNPRVQDEVFKIIDYWCKMGVDGFRLDAVPYLFERENTNGENLPETHDYLKKLRAHVDESFPGTLLLAEANMWPEDSASYFGNGDECHMNYHFPVMPRMFMALQMEDRYPITDIYEQTPAIHETCQWAIFLRNHDELTLEMVTDEERDYMYKVYAKDPKAKINLGIRHRLAPLMENNRRKIELLNFLLFSLPGTPVIYYGDEIGMGDNVYLGDRNGVRTPMQWSPDRNAGFSEANPQKLYLPIILDPEYHYESVNVETQRRNTSSLFWFMKHMIGMRKKYKAFSRGDMKFINVDNHRVLAFTRTYQNETILVVVNLSRYSQAAELELIEYKGYLLQETFSRNRFPHIKDEGMYFFTLAPHACHWFILEKAHPEVADKKKLPKLNVTEWKELSSTKCLNQLQNEILPDYISSARWHTGKSRIMHNVRIIDNAPMQFDGSGAVIFLLEVSYESGLPSYYQLPLMLVDEARGNRLAEDLPLSMIARMDNSQGFLVDALFVQEYQLELFRRMSKGLDISLKKSEINFYGKREMKKLLNSADELRPKWSVEEELNAAITYDNKFFLKIYRNLDRAINPDLEITRFLSEELSVKFVPEFVGSIEWKYSRDSVVLGMMQEMIEYHGDGWTYLGDRNSEYYEQILSKEKSNLPVLEALGPIVDPIAYDDIPQVLKELIGGTVAEGMRILGERTAAMHKVFASITTNKDFVPEDFSLHYQRSLFSGFQSLVRSTFSGQTKNIKRLDDEIRPQVEQLISRKDELLKMLRRIYAHKLDVIKTRIHGNFHLGQVLFTGKDIVIRDFGGDPLRTYSERRLKRSPLRDVAIMIRSIYYASHRALISNNQVRPEDIKNLQPFADTWAHYVAGFFLHTYLKEVKGEKFIPSNKKDLDVMIQTYLLEKALYDLNQELQNRPDHVVVPLQIIQTILNK